MDNAIFIKPEYWSYEQEWRIALILPLNCGRTFVPGIETKNYYMTIPKKWLKQITFGFRLDNQHCQEITETLKENGYENISINTIQLSHDTFELSTVLYKIMTFTLLSMGLLFGLKKVVVHIYIVKNSFFFIL